jgi:hypothetical protein
MVYVSASGRVFGVKGCPPECPAGCCECDSADAELEAARKRVRAWFRAQVLLSLGAVTPGAKAERKRKPTPFNGALRQRPHELA